MRRQWRPAPYATPHAPLRLTTAAHRRRPARGVGASPGNHVQEIGGCHGELFAAVKIVVAVTLLVLSSVRLTAQDVFVPPTPIGIAKDGKVRTPKRPIPLPAADQRWIRVRTQHFDLISSAS